MLLCYSNRVSLRDLIKGTYVPLMAASKGHLDTVENLKTFISGSSNILTDERNPTLTLGGKNP